MDLETVNKYLGQLGDMAIAYAPKLLLAIVALLVGLRVINWLVHHMVRALERGNVSEEIRPFLGTLLGSLLKIMLVFSVAGILGIETASFVAVLAAAGFAIGLALQGSLSNFAAGVMILIFRPYKGGDLIEVEGSIGHVKEIQIFNTVIITPDHKTVIIPNSTVMGGTITNHSTEGYLRVDCTVAMPYSEDFPRIQQLLLEAVAKHPKVLADPAPTVGILDFDSHSITLAVRPYANTEDYWEVYFDTNQTIKSALHREHIPMAYSEGVELGPIGG